MTQCAMSVRGARASRLGLLLALILVPPPSRGEAVYDATVSADLSTLTVVAHFTAGGATALQAGDHAAGRYLTGLRVDGIPAKLPRDAAEGIGLTGAARDHRVSYTVNLGEIERDRQVLRFGTAGTHALLMDPGTWLWLPDGGRSTTLRMHLPEGVSISAPWPRIGGAGNEFAVGNTSGTTSALVAIGRFDVETLRVPGAAIRFALLDGDPPPDREAIRNWVRQGASAVAGLYGSFPLRTPQILIVPVGRNDEPVPWGQVLRGGGVGAQLYVDQTRPYAELRDDWVLVHELSHMLHPNLHEEGAWLAEGIATYYQNVLRARAGLIPERLAWQKLHEGFGRGRAQTRTGVTLRDATRDMLAQRLFMRVYWSGAAIVLLGDLALRRDGGSLDHILSRFRECCLDEPRGWTAPEFLEVLDRLAGHPVFMPLYRQYADSGRFPDLSDAYADLGLSPDSGAITPSSGPDAAALRGAIMGRASR